MKKEYAEEVAARIIEQLEQGTAPWQKPWKPGELRLPFNPTTGKEYTGMNSMWLAMQGQSDPRWMTYNQASAEGGQVKKGSKGTHIVYWKFSEERKATDDQGRPIFDPETGKQKTINVQLERPRSFMAVVFNAAQIDGFPPLEARPTMPEPERHERAEAILANSGADIRHSPGDRAFYRPSTDSITLPERSQFPTGDAYYATALHEVGHWTGHPSRLDRDLSHPFGSEGYAREELRAEIASLMLGDRLDIGHDPEQHAAYVGSWIKALKEDPKEIFRAAGDAGRIASYVMGFEQEQTQSVERQAVPAIYAPEPEVMAALQEQHANAVEGHSPLTSWERIKEVAAEGGYTARIDFASDATPEVVGQPGVVAYEISFEDRTGDMAKTRAVMDDAGNLNSVREDGDTIYLLSAPEEVTNGPLSVIYARLVRDWDDATKTRSQAAELVEQSSEQRQSAPIPQAWRGVACTAFDEEMATRMDDPNYYRAQAISSMLSTYQEMRFEPSDREKAILQEKQQDIEDAQQWISENVLQNPLIKQKVYETVRDIARYTGDPEDDKELRDYLAENGPRWLIERIDTFKQPLEREVIGQTDSAAEALMVFLNEADTTVTDNYTGEVEGRTSWVRDGAATEWTPSAKLEAMASMEARGIRLPQLRPEVSFDDQQLAEGLALVANHFDKANFGYELLTRQIGTATAKAFGEPVPGIRASALPEQWSGQARAIPVVTQGSYEAGDEQDRPAVPGEQPDRWRIEVENAAGEWQWFANDPSSHGEAAAETVQRLNTIAEMAGITTGQDDLQQGVPEAQAYTVQSRRTVPEDAARHAGQQAVYVQLDDGRRAWGFGGTDEAAEKSAVSQAQRVGLDADRQPTRPVLHEQPEKPMNGRTYLAVPFREKDEAKAAAKAAGFKLGFDPDAKAWYAPEGVDLAASGLARWSADKANVVKSSEPKPALDQFYDALRGAGLVVKQGDVPTTGDEVGKIQRVPVIGDKGGATSGAYAFHEDKKADGRVVYGGYIQNFKTGEVVPWKPEGKTPELTAVERAELANEAQARKQERDKSINAKHETTATAAQALWNASPAATADNAYCKAKGITNPVGLRTVPDTVPPELAALGIKIAKTAKEAKALRDADPANRVFKSGDLLIPGQDSDGKIWTLQSVNPYFKSLMKGGRKAGLFTFAGSDAADGGKGKSAHFDPKNDTPLVLAEGYATADTVSRLMGGKAVVVAFDSGNIDAVARDLRERNPNRPLLIAADNDHNAPKELDAKGKPKVNVGLVKAQEAAKAHGGGVMAPQFKDGDKGSDWNDLANTQGDEAARRMLNEQMVVAKRDAAITAERLTTLARTRDMEARNDPTTSADDAAVSIERGHAADVMAGAQSALGEVRSMAADGMSGGPKGAGRSAASVKAGISHKVEAMHDRANEERQDVLNHAQPGALDGSTAGVSWKKLPEQVKQQLIADVQSGKDVTLPKDAPTKLKQQAGIEPTPAQRSRSRGTDAGL